MARALAFAEGSGMPEQVARHAAAAFLPSPEHLAGLAAARPGRRWTGCGSTCAATLTWTAAPCTGCSTRAWPTSCAPTPAKTPPMSRPRPGRPGLAAPVRDDPRWPGRIAAMAARRALPAAARRPARRRRRPARRPAPGHRLPHPRRPSHPGAAARRPARGAADGAADTYRASYASHSRQPPAARAQILAVDAARYGNLGLAQRLSSAALWQPVWATSQSRSARLRLTLTGHTGAVNAVAVGRAGDRDVIVSGSEDGTVRVWDAATGQPVGPPLTGHTGPVLRWRWAGPVTAMSSSPAAMTGRCGSGTRRAGSRPARR